MKKLLCALTALSLSTVMSACAMHNDQQPGYAQNGYHDDWQHKDWEHKEHMRMMQAMFSAMDKNGDGVVTRKEYDSYMRKWFHEADQNGDGKLTFGEFREQMKREKEKLKARHDDRHVQNGMNEEDRRLDHPEGNDSIGDNINDRNGPANYDQNGNYQPNPNQ